MLEQKLEFFRQTRKKYRYFVFFEFESPKQILILQGIQTIRLTIMKPTKMSFVASKINPTILY